MKTIPVTSGTAGVVLWVGLILLLKFPPDWVNLSSSPVLLILASSLYSLVLPLRISLLFSGLAVLMFNYEMVPPQNTLHVDLHEHGMLLVTMMVVSALMTYLLRRQKQLAGLERQHAQRIMQLMQWSETLRES
ncbi:MAG TPA: DUF4118 domain-containing protein, partial [Limnobacter sp.]|nr:DUF4118 domain-containing protein [Limnobacter sp.]